MDNVKFRDKAIMAVTRNALGITIHFREIGRPDADGHTPTVKRLPDLVLRYDQLSQAVRAEAFGYGIEVRLTRASALPANRKDGSSAPVSEKREAVKRLIDHYASGTEAWEMPSLGGSGLSAEVKVLIEALVRALGLDADVAEEQVRGMTTAERDVLRVAPEVKPHIEAIYRERAANAGAAAGSAADLLARLKKA